MAWFHLIVGSNFQTRFTNICWLRPPPRGVVLRHVLSPRHSTWAEGGSDRRGGFDHLWEIYIRVLLTLVLNIPQEQMRERIWSLSLYTFASGMLTLVLNIPRSWGWQSDRRRGFDNSLWEIYIRVLLTSVLTIPQERMRERTWSLSLYIFA